MVKKVQQTMRDVVGLQSKELKHAKANDMLNGNDIYKSKKNEKT